MVVQLATNTCSNGITMCVQNQWAFLKVAACWMVFINGISGVEPLVSSLLYQERVWGHLLPWQLNARHFQNKNCDCESMETKLGKSFQLSECEKQKWDDTDHKGATPRCLPMSYGPTCINGTISCVSQLSSAELWMTLRIRGPCTYLWLVSSQSNHTSLMNEQNVKIAVLKTTIENRDIHGTTVGLTACRAAVKKINITRRLHIVPFACYIHVV